MKPTEAHTLPKTLGTFPLWGIAVGLVISGEYFGWSYGWDKAGTLGFLVTSAFVALMYTTFIFSFTELTTAIPHAGGPFEYSRRAFGPIGGYLAGFATLVEFVFAPPAIALAIGAYLNVQFPALEPKWVALGAYLVFMALNIVGVTIAATFELVVTLIAIFELLRLHGRGGAGLLGGELPQGRLVRRRHASAAAPGRHVRRDPVRDLVLPRDRGRGHGRRGSEEPEPLDPDRLHRRHPDAGGAGARRDGVRGRRRRLDQARQHQRPAAAGDEDRRRRRTAAGCTCWCGSACSAWSPPSTASSSATRGRSSRSRAPATCRRCSAGSIRSFGTPHIAILAGGVVGIAAIFSDELIQFGGQSLTANIVTMSVFGAIVMYIVSMASLFKLRRSEPRLARPFAAPVYPLFPGVRAGRGA